MVLTCPYCLSNRITFTFKGQYQWTSNPHTWNTFWVCRKCEEGIVVKLVGPSHSLPSDCPGDPRDAGFDLYGIRPRIQQFRAPANVPDAIARDFEEALDNLRRQKWTSAGMMFRKVLQRATTEMAPEGIEFRNMRLIQRINSLDKHRLITPAMKDWAHKIRLDGNEATHEEDEDFSGDQARLMKEFTELLLIYSFTLPARITASNDPIEPEN